MKEISEFSPLCSLLSGLAWHALLVNRNTLYSTKYENKFVLQFFIKSDVYTAVLWDKLDGTPSPLMIHMQTEGWVGSQFMVTPEC